MSNYIDHENYCKNICHCSREKCDKSKCPIWTAPSADVRPVVRGEWQFIRKTADGGDFKCSVCGRIVTTNSFVRIENFPFCHCGADMRGEFR